MAETDQVTCDHLSRTLDSIRDFHSLSKEIVIDGHQLSIVQILAVASNPKLKVKTQQDTDDLLEKNARFLADLIDNGKIIYGVNTGYGGSADVRSHNIVEVQKSLVRHLNAGFGDTLPSDVVRALLLVRANSLCHGYSGVRPAIVRSLLDMLAHDILPVVPLRGSVSASGDLMPTSYIAACMMGRDDAMVNYQGKQIPAPEAFKQAGIEPIEFITKEALAVVNSASCAASMAAMVLFDANVAAVLTQVATAMSVESLCGRVESFHPTIHKCLPHSGQREAAHNISRLLKGSQFAIQELDLTRKDTGKLKQDRYALRTSAQWLAPVLETLLVSVRRVEIEVNGANDNPIIDHRREEVLHGGNFQGVSITTAMDQSRQSIQLCGKLLFAQMSEILNWKYSEGLPPNLNGSDINLDFGFKGTDTAMASYCSELDYLTPPLTNHVLSAEMHNQAVNSMALVSARVSTQALEILQMMLANIFRAQVQAVDLRWLQERVEGQLSALLAENLLSQQYRRETWPWYDFAFSPRDTFGRVYDRHIQNGVSREEFVERQTRTVEGHISELTDTETGPDKVAARLGQGTRPLYLYIRKTLGVEFYRGTCALDTSLQTIYSAIRGRHINSLLADIFKDI